MSLVAIHGVTLVYKGATGDVLALQDTTLAVPQGEFAAVVGSSTRSAALERVRPTKRE